MSAPDPHNVNVVAESADTVPGNPIRFSCPTSTVCQSPGKLGLGGGPGNGSRGCASFVSKRGANFFASNSWPASLR